MYSRNLGDKELSFGVSGMLYKANVLMYDRQTDSLWSQVRREAVTGPMTGEKLEVLPSTITTWEKWLKKYPGTEVLSINTGYSRDYSKDPYESYYESQKGFLAFFKPGPNEQEKQLVIGVTVDDHAAAYPLSHLQQKKRISDSIEGTKLNLTYSPETDRVEVVDGKNEKLEFVILYWFVWKSMYPESILYSN